MKDPILLASSGHTQTATSELIVRGTNEPTKGTRKSIVRTASSAILLLLFLTG